MRGNFTKFGGWLRLSGLFGLSLMLVGLVTPVLPAFAVADPSKTGYPGLTVSTGDSITRAFGSGSSVADVPENSWSTGTNSAVNSHYQRILAANSAVSSFNAAVSGAKMVDLSAQMNVAIAKNADYLTILMGANDVCASDEASMTPVATFRSQFQAALASLSSGLPDARIFVASIPDIYNLWLILHKNAAAVSLWSMGICPAMLAKPDMEDQPNNDRRARVRQRIIDFNTQLAQICATFLHCRFDNNAVFNDPFTPADVSGLDYYHPSVIGQSRLASVSYAASYNFSEALAPTSTISQADPVSGGFRLTLTATDNAGVAGIEYRTEAGNWQSYPGPTNFVSPSAKFSYRAVDLNGNVEAARYVYLITKPVDDGLNSTAGTLSYALTDAIADRSNIYFALSSGTIIQLNQKLPDVPPGLKIEAACNNGKPTITLDGTGTPPGTPGLVLGGRDSLKGLKLSGFKGKSVIANSKGNRLACIAVSK